MIGQWRALGVYGVGQMAVVVGGGHDSGVVVDGGPDSGVVVDWRRWHGLICRLGTWWGKCPTTLGFDGLASWDRWWLQHSLLLLCVSLPSYTIYRLYMCWFDWLYLLLLLVFHHASEDACFWLLSRGKRENTHVWFTLRQWWPLPWEETSVDKGLFVKLREFIEEECIAGLCSMKRGGALTHKHFQMVVRILELTKNQWYT